MTEASPLEGNVTTMGTCGIGLADGAAARLLTALKAGADENGRAVFRLGGFGELIVEPTQVVLRREGQQGALSVTGYRYSLYRFSEAGGEPIKETQALRLLEAHKRRLVTEAVVDLAATLGEVLA